MPVEMEGRKKSVFWDFFEKNDVNKGDKKATAKCKICQAIVSLGGIGKSATTSNLRYHLQKFHSAEFERITHRSHRK